MKPSSKKTQEFIRAYDEYADPVFRYCLFKLSNREIAKDLVPEPFIQTWQYLGTGRPVDTIKALFSTGSRNLIIDEYRKKKTLSLEALQEGGFDAEDGRSGDIILSAETAVILQAIEKLEPHFREVIVMRYVHDLSPKEIADILGEKANAVSVRLNRAVHKAQEILNLKS